MSVQPNQIDDLLERLDEYEVSFENHIRNFVDGRESEEPQKPHFEVTDKSSAEWVMRKIAKLQEQVIENNKVAREQLAPLEVERQFILAWEETELSMIIKHQDFLKSLLEPYHRMILKADPKAKTIKLPHGEMKIRSRQPEIKVDNEKLVEWLDEGDMGEFINRTPKWGELKKLCKVKNGVAIYLETGEPVDGITASDRPDKFEVTVK